MAEMMSGEPPRVSDQPTGDGNEPIWIKWGRKTCSFYYSDSATVNCLAMPIMEEFSVPTGDQMLVGKGVPAIKTDSEESMTTLLKSIEGKTLLLLGRPTWESDSPATIQEGIEAQALSGSDKNAPTLSKEHQAREQSLEVACSLCKQDQKHRVAILGKLYYKPLDKKALEAAGPYVRRKEKQAPGLGSVVMRYFEKILGTHSIPRLECHHIPETPHKVGCIPCISRYIVNWYAFAITTLEFEATRCEEILSTKWGSESGDATSEMEAQIRTIRDKYIKRELVGGSDPLSRVIANWCEMLDSILDRRQSVLTAEDLKDIDAFYTAIHILEGGLGQEQYADS